MPRRTVDPPRRRRRREEEEGDHGSHERWLVTYADMLTLLFVLFVILFSMSHIDELKYQELKEGLAAGFGQATSLLSGSPSILQGQTSDSKGTDVEMPQVGAQPVAPTFTQDSPQVKAEVAKQVQQAMAQMTQRTTAEAKTNVNHLLLLWQRIHKVLEKKGLQDDVQASIDQRGLVISMVSRHIVFPYNLATLTPRGQEIVDVIGSVISQIPDPIEIDGSTNQQKVKPKYFANDWDLAYARAATVLGRLQHTDGVATGRLRAVSFGHTKPLIDPHSPLAAEINKRVDIVVLSNAPGETRDLYTQVAGELPPAQAKLLTPASPGGKS